MRLTTTGTDVRDETWKGSVRRAVPFVLVAVAALQVGAILAVFRGTVARGEGPLPTSVAGLPPSGATARGDLAASPRRAELVDVEMPGSAMRIPTWVVYPEQSRAPVVMVVHDLYGLSDWVRSVADAFAAEGFVAVAPDLLKGMVPGGGDGRFFIDGMRIVPTVNAIGARERTSRLDAVRTWALGLPVADRTSRRRGIQLGRSGKRRLRVGAARAGCRGRFLRRRARERVRLRTDRRAGARPVRGRRQRRPSPGPPRQWRLPAGPIVYEGATVFLKAQEGLAANRRATGGRARWRSSGNIWAPGSLRRRTERREFCGARFWGGGGWGRTRRLATCLVALAVRVWLSDGLDSVGMSASDAFGARARYVASGQGDVEAQGSSLVE